MADDELMVTIHFADGTFEEIDIDDETTVGDVVEELKNEHPPGKYRLVDVNVDREMRLANTAKLVDVTGRWGHPKRHKLVFKLDTGKPRRRSKAGVSKNTNQGAQSGGGGGGKVKIDINLGSGMAPIEVTESTTFSQLNALLRTKYPDMSSRRVVFRKNGKDAGLPDLSSLVVAWSKANPDMNLAFSPKRPPSSSGGPSLGAPQQNKSRSNSRQGSRPASRNTAPRAGSNAPPPQMPAGGRNPAFAKFEQMASAPGKPQDASFHGRTDRPGDVKSYAREQRAKSRMLDGGAIELPPEDDGGDGDGLDKDFHSAIERTFAGKAMPKKPKPERKPTIRDRVVGYFVARKQKDKITDAKIKQDIKARVWRNNAIKEGWLFKEGGSRKTWHKRWFIFHAKALYYFENSNSQEPKGVVSLVAASLEPNYKKPGHPHCFSIRTPTRQWFIAAEDQKSHDSWVNALQRRLGKGVGVVADSFGGSRPDISSSSKNAGGANARPLSMLIQPDMGPAGRSAGKSPSRAPAPAPEADDDFEDYSDEEVLDDSAEESEDYTDED